VRHPRPALESLRHVVFGDRTVGPRLELQAQPVEVELSAPEAVAVEMNFQRRISLDSSRCR
jgi:hypothetical protein